MTRLLYMLARYTDIMSDDDVAVDMNMTFTFDNFMSGGHKRSAVERLSWFTGDFLPPGVHPNLEQLLGTIGGAVHFFIEARHVSSLHHTDEEALGKALQNQADLCDGPTKSPNTETALRTAERRIKHAQDNMGFSQRERTILERRKNTLLPFRYRTFLEALDEARVDFDSITLEEQPKHGCNKVSDRVEAAIKSGKRLRLGYIPLY